jgi:hypothetical protein
MASVEVTSKMLPAELSGLVFTIVNKLPRKSDEDVQVMFEREEELEKLPGVTHIIGPKSQCLNYNVFLDRHDWKTCDISDLPAVVEILEMMVNGKESA